MEQACRSAIFRSASRGSQSRVWPYLVKREHVARNVPLRESRSGVREEISPLSLERLERGGISKPWVSFRHRLHRHVGL